MLRKITDDAEIFAIVDFFRGILPSQTKDRQWHLHKALNSLAKVLPVISFDVWSDDSAAPSFCFQTETYKDRQEVHIFFVDTEIFDLDFVEVILQAWIQQNVMPNQAVCFDSFPAYLHKDGMFSKSFAIRHESHHPTLWLQQLKSVVLELPSHVKLGVLNRSDVALIVAKWKYSRGSDSVRVCEQLIAGDVPSSCVRTADGRLVGYFHFNNQGTLGNLMVDADFRKLKLATALTHELCKKMLAINCLPLIEIDEGNRPAVALFTKLGFEFVAKSVYLEIERKDPF